MCLFVPLGVVFASISDHFFPSLSFSLKSIKSNVKPHRLISYASLAFFYSLLCTLEITSTVFSCIYTYISISVILFLNKSDNPFLYHCFCISCFLKAQFSSFISHLPLPILSYSVNAFLPYRLQPPFPCLFLEDPRPYRGLAAFAPPNPDSTLLPRTLTPGLTDLFRLLPASAPPTLIFKHQIQTALRMPSKKVK